MAISISDIVGADNMKIEKKADVIALLKSIDQPNTTKRYLFARWSRLVGFSPTKEDIDAVAPWQQ